MGQAAVMAKAMATAVVAEQRGPMGGDTSEAALPDSRETMALLAAVVWQAPEAREAGAEGAVVAAVEGVAAAAAAQRWRQQCWCPWRK